MTTRDVPVADPALRSSMPLLTRLSAMMFLQYFVQGAYLPIASIYVGRTLGFTPLQVGIFSSALAVGPLVAPFIIGQLVDRFFPTQYVMALCHLLGGVLMLMLAVQTEVWPVIVLGTVYSILYVPTMMLSNSLAFQHLANSKLEFPWIRLFGTLGYIAPAYVIEFWWLRGLEGVELDRARSVAFVLAGLMGVVMAGYCLSLPHTPPRREERSYAPGLVIAMLRERSFLVLVIISFLMAIAHHFLVTWFGPFVRDILDAEGWGAWEQSISSVGQICELVVLAVLGLLLLRLGFKRTMLLGLAAYLVRCLLYSLVYLLDPPFVGKLLLAGAGQALHGFCFGCFMAVGYMYVDRIATLDIRGSMQTLYGTFVLALGFFTGGFVSGWVVERFSTVMTDPVTGEALRTAGGELIKQRDWVGIWLACAALCAVCVLVFARFFPASDERTAESSVG